MLSVPIVLNSVAIPRQQKRDTICSAGRFPQPDHTRALLKAAALSDGHKIIFLSANYYANHAGQKKFNDSRFV